MTPNVPLLEKVYDHIVAHPDEWSQTTWRDEAANRCGTTFCFAGLAVMLSGYEWVSDDPHDDDYEYVRRPGDTVQLHVSHAAREELGLDDDTERLLFNGLNDLPALRYIIDDITSDQQP